MARFPGHPPVLIRKVPATAARTAADSVFVGNVFCTHTGDEENKDRRQVLQDGCCAGVRIIDRHEEGILCQTDTENSEKRSVSANPFWMSGWRNGRRRASCVDFRKKEIQRNQNDPGADLSDAENDGGWESQIVQEILTGTSGKSPAQCGEKDGKGAM